MSCGPWVWVWAWAQAVGGGSWRAAGWGRVRGHATGVATRYRRLGGRVCQRVALLLLVAFFGVHVDPVLSVHYSATQFIAVDYGAIIVAAIVNHGHQSLPLQPAGVNV